MNASELLHESIRRFQARFRTSSSKPVIYLTSLIQLADWAEEKHRPMVRCDWCNGWGLLSKGPCVFCNSLGFVPKRQERTAA